MVAAPGAPPPSQLVSGAHQAVKSTKPTLRCAGVAHVLLAGSLAVCLHAALPSWPISPHLVREQGACHRSAPRRPLHYPERPELV